MDQDQPASTDCVDCTSSIDTRLSTQRIITDGVRLVLAVREGERTLEELSTDGIAPTHDIRYILQKAKVDETKKELDVIADSLAALPHVPTKDFDELFDIRPLKKWMEKHRGQFDAFKAYCDELARPKSPLEEGEVHPDVERLSHAVGSIEHRVNSLARRVVNPQVLELERRAARLRAAHRQDSVLFSRFMNKFDFAELSEEGQRLAISQHVLNVARETFIGMTKQKAEDITGDDDSIFWLQALRYEKEDENHEMEERRLEGEGEYEMDVDQLEYDGDQ